MRIPGTELDFLTERLPGAALHDVLRDARERAPVVEVRFFGRPAWLITRYEELRKFFAAQDEFPGGAVYTFQTEPVIGRTFISMDGPDHDTYRQLAMPAFRSRATARFVDAELTPLAHELVDRFADRGEGDLVSELARVLPFWAISRKLGLPMGTEERQRRWALGLLSYPADPEGALAARDDVTAFLEPVVAERRATPGDDVISHLLGGEHRGVRFDDEEIFSHIRLLYAVGATTTSDAMANLFWSLLTRPDVLAQARTDPALRPRVVAETLRWEPPVALLPRLAVDGGEVGGVMLPRGALVLGGIASANRDADVFADPDRFDPARDEGEVLTFGFGTKFCPGSHLARRQLLAALDVVLERLPNLRLVDAAPPAGAVLRSSPSVRVAWDVG